MSDKTKKVPQTEAQNKLDPRMDAAIFNNLLPRAGELLNQPAINSRMREGMDMSYDYLKSPIYNAIFNQLLGQGSGLLGRGVAGNPYMRSTGGTMGGGTPFDPRMFYMPQDRRPMATPQMQAGPSFTNITQGTDLSPEERAYIQFAMQQERNARTG
jgi:hypothetical protein